MIAQPVAADRTPDRSDKRRSELDQLTHTEWPSGHDAHPARSAVVGLLRAHGRELSQADLDEVLEHRDYGDLRASAERLGVPFARLQVAVLVDGGHAHLVEAQNCDVAGVVADMPSLGEHDREIVLRLLAETEPRRGE